MFEGYIAGKFADKMFEEEVFQTIKKHAMVGALLMMIPDCGLGIIFFIAVLWHMYSSICDKVGISFSDHFWKLVGVGMMVNLLVVLISDIVFTVLFFLEGFIMYFQFYVSGKMFVESIKKMDVKKETQQLALPVRDDAVSIVDAQPDYAIPTTTAKSSSTLSDEDYRRHKIIALALIPVVLIIYGLLAAVLG